MKVGDLIPIGGSGNVKKSEVLTGKTYSSDEGVDLVGTMPNRGTLNRTLNKEGDTVNLSSGYYSGGSIKTQITNLTASNIKKGVNVGGVTGTLEEGYPVIGSYTGTSSWFGTSFIGLINLVSDNNFDTDEDLKRPGFVLGTGATHTTDTFIINKDCTLIPDVRGTTTTTGSNRMMYVDFYINNKLRSTSTFEIEKNSDTEYAKRTNVKSIDFKKGDKVYAKFRIGEDGNGSFGTYYLALLLGLRVDVNTINIMSKLKK